MGTSTESGGFGTLDPVTEGLNVCPKPLPKGVSFAHRVEVHEIDYQTARQIHENHHSYVNSGREQAFLRHGIYFDGHIVGAISWSYMLSSYPIGYISSDRYAELARVTIAIDMPNLASCSVAKSQRAAAEKFDSEEIRLLVTYIREDYEGTMFKALNGWSKDGHITRGHQAGNRPDRDIRNWDKVRWTYIWTPLFQSFEEYDHPND